MAIKPPPPPWEVLQQVGDLVGTGEMRREMDRNVRALAQSALARLDLVNREEFDAQAEVLRRTRARVEALERELADLAERAETRDAETRGADGPRSGTPRD